MDTKGKKLSNPFSTGGGGFHFEAHVQASYVTLMLTGGYAPCLPCWPIKEIKLQGKIDGYGTDDLIIIIENKDTKECRKLLGQIKHSIAITKENQILREVIQAAWNDFNNSNIFKKGKDVLALITGPISKTDSHNVQWLLNQARFTKNEDEFFRNVRRSNFSPAKSKEKLEVIQHHLKAVNNDVDITEEELYIFLKHFQLLGYDLGEEVGVVLSLIHSHISQFHNQSPQWIWSRVVEFVQTCNQSAGTITREMLPEDLVKVFKQQNLVEIPEELTILQTSTKTDWSKNPYASDLALVNLVGAWNEKNETDVSILSKQIGIGYREWILKAREILQYSGSPLSLKNGHWKITDRELLMNTLASRILDQNLETFRTLVVEVLTERDPSFELPINERFAANLHGKVFSHSQLLRTSLADGLAIIANNTSEFINCSQDKVETTAILAIRGIFADADWVLWGSLSNLLPSLAEAAPNEFLNEVEKALQMSPCPFDQLFEQESNGITGKNYITGLIWALEGLAWNEEYLVRVCDILGELSMRDPGGQWANRPANSLKSILLPWYPQTLASIGKRKVAVETLMRDWPDIGWKTVISLLPNQQSTSSGTHKPIWKKIIPENYEISVSQEDYSKQIFFYSELIVSSAGDDPTRLVELIDICRDLPRPSFDKLLEKLSSDVISDLPEDQRLSIWDHLLKIKLHHRKYKDSEWVLPEESLVSLETVANKLAPTSPLYLYKHLFSGRDYELFDEKDNWEEQQNQLHKRRDDAIEIIFQKFGINSILKFAETVAAPSLVGNALASLVDPSIEQMLLPGFLLSDDNVYTALVKSFIWRRHNEKGWSWIDAIDKSSWSPKQIGQFLSWLPFVKENWDRVEQWLGIQEGEYWSKADVHTYPIDLEISTAIDKLLEHNRPLAALECFEKMMHNQMPLNSDQCVRALLSIESSNEDKNSSVGYQIVEIIKYLQTVTSVSSEDLIKVEWYYLRLLEQHSGASPKTIENKLANDPEFFSYVFKLLYRSKEEERKIQAKTEESKALATNAWILLHNWKTPPGMQTDGTFNEDAFKMWLSRVKEICSESGLLDIALIYIGGVLVYSPAASDGLWINRTIAKALNDRDAEEMRNGYHTGQINARGVHWVDPTGTPEKELAKQCIQRANTIEDAGFHRLAGALRSLADYYEKQVVHIVDTYKNSTDK
jgi:hypothetical protein